MSNPFDAHFDGIGDVNASGNSVYVRPGTYLAKILGVFMKENRKKEAIFVVEMLVLKVMSHLTKTALGLDTVSNSAGTKMSQVIKFVGPGADMALPNIKGFAECAITGFAGATAEEQKQALAFATSDEQPLAGTIVEVDGAPILTRARTDFTQIRYARALTPEQVEAEGLTV